MSASVRTGCERGAVVWNSQEFQQCLIAQGSQWPHVKKMALLGGFLDSNGWRSNGLPGWSSSISQLPAVTGGEEGGYSGHFTPACDRSGALLPWPLVLFFVLFFPKAFLVVYFLPLIPQLSL